MENWKNIYIGFIIGILTRIVYMDEKWEGVYKSITNFLHSNKEFFDEEMIVDIFSILKDKNLTEEEKNENIFFLVSASILNSGIDTKDLPDNIIAICNGGK